MLCASSVPSHDDSNSLVFSVTYARSTRKPVGSRAVTPVCPTIIGRSHVTRAALGGLVRPVMVRPHSAFFGICIKTEPLDLFSRARGSEGNRECRLWASLSYPDTRLPHRQTITITWWSRRKNSVTASNSFISSTFAETRRELKEGTDGLIS